MHRSLYLLLKTSNQHTIDLREISGAFLSPPCRVALSTLLSPRRRVNGSDRNIRSVEYTFRKPLDLFELGSGDFMMVSLSGQPFLFNFSMWVWWKNIPLLILTSTSVDQVFKNGLNLSFLFTPLLGDSFEG
jgi:hypothetical protein